MFFFFFPTLFNFWPKQKKKMKVTIKKLRRLLKWRNRNFLIRTHTLGGYLNLYTTTFSLWHNNCVADETFFYLLPFFFQLNLVAPMVAVFLKCGFWGELLNSLSNKVAHLLHWLQYSFPRLLSLLLLVTHEEPIPLALVALCKVSILTAQLFNG